MVKPVTIRGWATPLTIGAFLLMAGTGVMMFFGLDGGVSAVIHQWFSWIFLFGAAGHVIANIRGFNANIGSVRGKLSVVSFATVFVASCFSWGMVTGPQIERPIEEALIDAPFSSLASLTRMKPVELVGKFRAIGVVATDHQTLRELSKTSGVDENRLLGIVFMPIAPK